MARTLRDDLDLAKKEFKKVCHREDLITWPLDPSADTSYSIGVSVVGCIGDPSILDSAVPTIVDAAKIAAGRHEVGYDYKGPVIVSEGASAIYIGFSDRILSTEGRTLSDERSLIAPC